MKFASDRRCLTTGAAALATVVAVFAGCGEGRARSPASPQERSGAGTPRGTIAVASSADFRTIFLISAATQRTSRVRAPDVLVDLRADLSRDGRKLVVSGYDSIWVFARNGAGARRMARASRSESPPSDASWAPSGREIVFGRDEGLYTIGADGKNEKRIFSGWVYAPDWSPTGAEIVFVRNPARTTGAGMIHAVRPDGRDLRPVVWGVHPDVSPDGTKVAFARRDGVYVAPMRGGKAKRIIANAEHPEWSRDGRYLAFTRSVNCGEAGCSGRVFIVPATGGRARAVGPLIFDIGPLSWSR